jgi:hypothetical protein
MVLRVSATLHTADTMGPGQPQYHPPQPPTTLGRHLLSKLWVLRLGHCNAWQLDHIPYHADGTPSSFSPHPFCCIDAKEQGCIQKKPIGHSPEKAPTTHLCFFMDFGFIRASTSDYCHPCLGVDRVVKCFKGFTAYLIIIDEASQYVWVFLRKLKKPPTNLVLYFLALHGLPSGGVIWTDLGCELAWSESFHPSLLQKAWYIVEPMGADNPLQNGGAEKWNHTLAVTTWSLLYGSGLPAWYWSAALLHVAYLHNRRVHCAAKMTPFESWFQQQPNLKHLRIFGSRVCIKQSGKPRAKLDQHHFDGIFIRYTATNHNIHYINIVSVIVKHSHHAVFNEAWYLQPSCPPAAQLLYDLGLQDNTLPTASQPATDPIVTLLPPCPKKYRIPLQLAVLAISPFPSISLPLPTW